MLGQPAVGPIGSSSCPTSPTNSSASAFAIAAARSGEVSVTAAESTTVSGVVVTVIRLASCAAVIGSCRRSTTGWVMRSSFSSGAYEFTRSFASWLAWYASSEFSA